MQIPRPVLDRIVEGEVTLAFRRWRRPTVRAGGTLRTAVGVLAIESVDPVDAEDIPAEEAMRAGYPDLPALRRILDRRPEGQVYRIALRPGGEDPRVALRETVATGDEADALRARLARWPWAHDLLRLLRDRPGVRAADLAESVGRPKPDFKADVRKLKELGLTESLPVGYRLSPRGAAYLAGIEVG
ncbi:ASCH domain-containing protein [Amycolatopsis suaedae]|uniref:ASCH domain-containing protein n=1 Tax=Amycolatopsis suaedae TaxID=2510978 RepID=A0A4Q7J9B5_9PSEU|nr:ASCH domain-containing protein [Amycolatopsis suaedae]RZQ62993.1 ASCH domain-containing protein [Amycolatopsis suaedae]